MYTFVLGILVGSLLTTTLTGAAKFYNGKGQLNAPSGSQQQFDYFRERQQFIDIGHMREQADHDRLERKTNPCPR